MTSSLLSVAIGRRRVAAITSAATGAGRALARAYADAGWDIALIGRGWAGLEAAAADVRARGREALVLPIDVTDDAARQLAIQRIQDELGPIEAWVADGLVPRHGPRPLRSRPRPSTALGRVGTWLESGIGAFESSETRPAIMAVAGALALGVLVGAISRRD
jgi:NAD(P)-dependent dehydrogenase (short-subunit alcohol dehydrogenase family)